MNIVFPKVELINPPTYEALVGTIELAGRTCYQSDDRIAKGSAETLIRNLIFLGHESVLEHGSITARIVCDRGVSHELVRHRLASYCQESTRYCNYSRGKFGSEITVIRPCFLTEGTHAFDIWQGACETAETAYFALLDWGCSPQQARAVLPNSLKTQITVTANPREWRHFFRQRLSVAAHPQMQEIAQMLYAEMTSRYPVLFEDIAGKTKLQEVN